MPKKKKLTVKTGQVMFSGAIYYKLLTINSVDKIVFKTSFSFAESTALLTQ